jgi:hypothetical protein
MIGRQAPVIPFLGQRRPLKPALSAAEGRPNLGLKAGAGSQIRTGEGPPLSTSTLDSGRQFGKNSFLKERTLNVVENKGPLWKTPERTGNVYENKGT